MIIERRIGTMLIIGALGVLIPYIILTITFDYPQILREDTGRILEDFHNGGFSLILTWWAFAICGFPLLIAYTMLGNLLEDRLDFVRWATNIGIIGLIVQMIGLLRWTFVVPVLAKAYINGDSMERASSMTIFQAMHQYAGVALGEHLGQLFTIIWTIAIARAFNKLKLAPGWLNWLGITSAIIYLFGQTELFATVIPSMPVISIAGFLGSTLWIVWLILLGVKLYNTRALKR